MFWKPGIIAVGWLMMFVDRMVERNSLTDWRIKSDGGVGRRRREEPEPETILEILLTCLFGPNYVLNRINQYKQWQGGVHGKCFGQIVSTATFLLSVFVDFLRWNYLSNYLSFEKKHLQLLLSLTLYKCWRILYRILKVVYEF